MGGGKKPGQTRAKILFGEAVPTPASPDGPKILFGATPRTRIPCSLAELRTLDPSAGDHTLEQALQVVNRVNLDDMYFEDVMKFGAGLQSIHADLTEQDLALARTSALPRAQKLQADILAELQRLDPAKVFGLNENWLQKLWRRLAGGPNVAQVFSRHYPQVVALAKALSELEPELTGQHRALKALARQYEALAREISGYILAVRYITGYIDGDEITADKKALYTSHIGAITDRQDSLRITLVTLQSGQMNLDLTLENTERMIGAGRRLLDQSLPTFQTAYSVAISAIRRGAGEDKSWLRRLSDSYGELLDNVNEKGE